MVELNRAVLWSYARDGVRITDHHTESKHFIAHLERERRAGRLTPADWSWIVPPMSASATPVFHRYYHEADQRPSFYLDADARQLAQTGRRVPAALAAVNPTPIKAVTVNGSNGSLTDGSVTNAAVARPLALIGSDLPPSPWSSAPR